MKYKILGSSGLKVSEICLGTMTFGEEFGIGAPEPECRRVFDSFLEAGGNFIDTANMYNQGTSERMLGKFIGERRHQTVLASKYSLTTAATDPNAGGSHPKNLVQSLEASLRRLKTDYLDLYWVHGWDGVTAPDLLMRSLDDQVRAGKILHIGFSNVPAWVVASANTLASERNMTTFSALQLHYNLIERSIEREHLALSRAQDMAVLAWSPLAGGLLTGKFNPDADPSAKAGARLLDSPRGPQTLQQKNIDIARFLAQMAATIGCSSAQLALAWMMQRSSPGIIPIIGARNHAQLMDNLGAVDVCVTHEQIAELDALNGLSPEYPQTLYNSEFFRQMMYGELGGTMTPPWNPS
jgi:aryl-alcohol dehydrogenase-like predicted oxidoreductase